MSNTFWAVFYGSTLGTFTVHLATGLYEDYRRKQRAKQLHLLFDHMEDTEYEFDEA